ncbi:MAG: class I SAM-dependent methyltransferase [Actinomycetota bacterium]
MAVLDPKTANERYHDAAAATYEEKWSINFDPPSVAYVRDRAERMLAAPGYRRVLEVGAGTGFFLLNLWQAGVVEEAHATDISGGMLEVCRRNGALLGTTVHTRIADAERLPYDDGEFDLVVGHAFLHHIPEPEAALAEMARVLRPGGTLFVAGEPTRWGHRITGVSKWAARTALRAADGVPGVRLRHQRPVPATDDERTLRDLEWEVDLHTFDPKTVSAWARAAGLRDVRVETEELIAAWFGWAVRTIEGEVRPGLLGRRWARFAMLGWRALYTIDRRLEGVVPPALFYNLLLSARKPGG